jgi:hypothetical protein
MEVKLVITEENGNIIEVQGEAAIFYILEPQDPNKEGISEGHFGISGPFSALDLEKARRILNNLLINSLTETMLSAVDIMGNKGKH